MISRKKEVESNLDHVSITFEDVISLMIIFEACRRNVKAIKN